MASLSICRCFNLTLFVAPPPSPPRSASPHGLACVFCRLTPDGASSKKKHARCLQIAPRGPLYLSFCFDFFCFVRVRLAAADHLGAERTRKKKI
ncbi:hypothetical protein [Pandoravirus japonicus]|uniref:Uncharacterized protein n=1 Tax=Pandoravirus japonicus TaxID=2823154 RepID=A0A811BMN0_9VIRU|nr:hypothetical protein [Pandoravirus japonicus]